MQCKNWQNMDWTMAGKPSILVINVFLGHKKKNILSKTSFSVWQQEWVVATETTCPKEPNILLSIYRKIC